MTFYIKKNIDVVSHADGKRYTDVRKYEQSLDKLGKYVMSEKEFKQTREELMDTRNQAKDPSKPTSNHLHIDLRNGKDSEFYDKDVQ